jgi:hypothetical protein
MDAVSGISFVDQPSCSKDGILQGDSLAIESDKVNFRKGKFFLQFIGKQQLNLQEIEGRGSSVIVHQDGNVQIAQRTFLAASRGAKLVGRYYKRVSLKKWGNFFPINLPHYFFTLSDPSKEYTFLLPPSTWRRLTQPQNWSLARSLKSLPLSGLAQCTQK